MNATKTETIRELLQRKGDRYRDERLSLTLVRFGRGENYLRLVEQPDGRIDIVDMGCDDTGTNVGDDDVATLDDQITEWLRCVEESAENATEVWSQESR